MKSRISVVKIASKKPNFLRKLDIYALQNVILEQIRAKILVKSDGIRDFASIHVFTEEELAEFIQKVEKQVYNAVASAKLKGSC